MMRLLEVGPGRGHVRGRARRRVGTEVECARVCATDDAQRVDALVQIGRRREWVVVKSSRVGAAPDDEDA